jgi:hypothetical protein
MMALDEATIQALIASVRWPALRFADLGYDAAGAIRAGMSDATRRGSRRVPAST